LRNEIAIFLALLALFILTAMVLMSRWPRRKRALEQAHLSRFFHGLVLFGLDGSYVDVSGPEKGDRITFTKRLASECEMGWWLEVSIASSSIAKDFVHKVSSDMETLRSRFEWKTVASDEKHLASALAGSGVRDPAGLEAVAKVIIRNLGHAATARYRIDFEGPKDHKAVDQYFGFER
jgi:hypothetical protein